MGYTCLKETMQLLRSPSHIHMEEEHPQLLFALILSTNALSITETIIPSRLLLPDLLLQCPSKNHSQSQLPVVSILPRPLFCTLTTISMLRLTHQPVQSSIKLFHWTQAPQQRQHSTELVKDSVRLASLLILPTA